MLSINRKWKRATAGVLDELLMFSLSSPQVPYSIGVEHACDSVGYLLGIRSRKIKNNTTNSYPDICGHSNFFLLITFVFCYFILFFCCFSVCFSKMCPFLLFVPFVVFYISLFCPKIKTCGIYKKLSIKIWLQLIE